MLRHEIERLTAGIRALRTVRALIREGGDVGKLSSIAERIRDTKTRLDAEADKLAARLDDIDHAAPVAFSRGHAFLTAQASEVAEIEDTLRQLSNLPLDGSEDLPLDSPAAQKILAAQTPPVAGSPDHAAFVRRTQEP